MLRRVGARARLAGVLEGRGGAASLLHSAHSAVAEALNTLPLCFERIYLLHSHVSLDFVLPRIVQNISLRDFSRGFMSLYE